MASTPSHTYCIVGVKNVGGGGVVHDDDLREVATQAAQVFDVITPVKDAGLAEEAATESPPLIQEVRNRVCVLRSRTCWLIQGDISDRGGGWAESLTLAKLAVKRTHSNSSPILFKNSSTWGRFSTYTYRTHFC